MEQEVKVMIITVGGSPEPIIKSINSYRPETVYFIPSESSMTSIIDIMVKLDFKPIQKIKPILDPNNIIECYKIIADVCNEIQNTNIEPQKVIADYTGGTKSMSAALVLAASGRGYYFSYIGGTIRDKEGLGIVTSGNEKLYSMLDPREIFKIDEKNNIKNYFNSYRFSVAVENCEKIIAATDNKKEKTFYTLLKQLIQGYQNWDIFDHKEASKLIGDSISDFENILPFLENKNIEVFISKSIEASNYLGELKGLVSKNKYGINNFVIKDLIANAKRRYQECKYDDAIARLYRVLEMIAQNAIFIKFKHTTSAFPIAEIPETLKEEYSQKYISKKDKNKLEFGSFAAFKLLNELDINEGKVFVQNETEFRTILEQRNRSILAHGSVPINKDSFEKFLNLITEKFEISDLPEFPIIEELF